MKIKDIIVAYTHGGCFHADDVFASALLRIWGYTGPIHRVFNVPEEKDGVLIYDIGLGRFDHHQENRQKRENGTIYAAFGLLAREFYSEFLTNKEYKLLDEEFIQPLDAADNGMPGTLGNPLSMAIRSFNPCWNEETSFDEAFEEAVTMAIPILARELKRVKSLTEAEAVAHAVKPKNGIVYLDRYAPIGKFFSDDPTVRWSFFPDVRGGFNISVLKDRDGNDKDGMPIQFRGKPREFLPKGMRFCHPTGFMAVFDEKEDALQFACQYLERKEGDQA